MEHALNHLHEVVFCLEEVTLTLYNLSKQIDSLSKENLPSLKAYLNEVLCSYPDNLEIKHKVSEINHKVSSLLKAVESIETA